MNFDPQQKGMHPKDKRNLIIFVMISLGMWFAFEHFVMGPRVEKIKQQQAITEASAPQSAVSANDGNKIIDREVKLTEVKRITIDTPELSGSIPLVGNRIDDIVLKNYYDDLEKTKKVVLMSPSDTTHPHYAELGWLAGSNTVKVPDNNSTWTVKGNATLSPATPVTLSWSNGEGLSFERQFAIDENYMLTITQKVTNTGKGAVDIYPYAALTRKGIPPGHENGVGYEGPLGYIADELQEIHYDDLVDDGAQKFTALNGWIGFGEKYWLAALVPPQGEQATFSFQASPNLEDDKQNVYQVDVRGEKETIAAGQSIEETSNLFIGAKKVKLLDQYEQKLGIKHFDLAVDFGVLYF